MKKKIIVAISIVAILAIAAIFLFKGSDNKYHVQYETAKIAKATIGNSVTATGTIEAVTEVEVGTQVSGIINKIYVDYNSVVKKGQVIAELDKTNLTSELNTAQNNLANYKSDLDYQATNFKRMKVLHDKGLISANEYEEARVSYQKALGNYHSGLEAVNKAKTNLSYATITSPIDGVVLSKSVEVGQTVAASFSTPTLFTIAKDLTDMRVIAKVDEADIGEVNEGQRVTFTVDAFPYDTFEGTVTQVRQEGVTENNVVTYEVVVSAPNKDLKLKPGLTANVTIYTLERTGVVSVPAKALRFTPTKEVVGNSVKIIDTNSKTKLWTFENNTFKAHAVTTGITNGIRTEIKSGLSEGTAVIVDFKAGNENSETASDESSTTEQSPFAPGPRNSKQNNKQTSGSTTQKTTTK